MTQKEEKIISTKSKLEKIGFKVAFVRFYCRNISDPSSLTIQE